jgi:hypothetical protein
MTMKTILRIATVAAFLSGGLALTETAWAQGAAAPAASGASSGKMKAAPAPRSAKSMECSKKADEMKLHGKARREFRNKCKRGES